MTTLNDTMVGASARMKSTIMAHVEMLIADYTKQIIDMRGEIQALKVKVETLTFEKAFAQGEIKALEKRIKLMED